MALTANAMSGDREKYLEAGLTDYVAKPIMPNELYEVLERQCGTKPPESGSLVDDRQSQSADELRGMIDKIDEMIDAPG